MEPRREEQQPSESRPEQKPRRFRLVKLEEQRFRIVRLEERIAPGCATGGGGGGNSHNKHCVSVCGWGCTASGC